MHRAEAGRVEVHRDEVHGPGPGERRALVVIGHGVTSDKDRPWSEALSSALAERGVPSLRIAFSGNGESEGRFEDATITKEAADLGAVLDALEPTGPRLHYVGHSMGGAVGLVRAAMDGRLRSLVSLAAVTHTGEFVRRMFGHLQPGEPMLGKPHCPWSPALGSDLEAIHTLAGATPLAPIPWLAVHGTADDVVPVEHSRDLARASQGRCTLIELEGVDHSFTGPGLGALVEAVVPWLELVL